MRIRRIHRITLAVLNAAGAATTFEQLLDERAGPVELVREFGVRSVDIPLGETLLQLVSPSPTDSDNPVRSFLQRKGEGFYNVALEVDDLDGAIAELAHRDVRVSQPVEAEPGIRSAFVTMSATHGLSVQLVQVRREEGEPLVEPVTRVEQPRAEHMAPAPAPPVSEPHPAAHETADWSDADEPPSAPAPKQPASPASTDQHRLIDLTPEEWSDED
ncbi:MAG: VOC family protein [Chloroflexi bacterium]|nr:VOC family protein [Chloroflexota bacterium]